MKSENQAIKNKAHFGKATFTTRTDFFIINDGYQNKKMI